MLGRSAFGKSVFGRSRLEGSLPGRQALDQSSKLCLSGKHSRLRVARAPWHSSVLLTAFLLLGICPTLLEGAAKKSPPEAKVQPKLLFIGVDGASWKMMGRLLEEGSLPTFAKLMREGAHSRAFDTLEGGASPLIWTTIATGRSPEDHGITSFVTEIQPGVRVPVTSSSRKARAIWELAGARGKSIGVIGYWASWPAEEVNGYVITDHANPAFSEFMFKDGRLWSGMGPDRLTKLGRDFYPKDLASTLGKYWTPRERFDYADMKRRGGFTDVQMELLERAPWNVFDDYYSLLKTMYRVDYPLFLAAQDLMVNRPTDMLILYLRGPDPIQHLAWDVAEPEAYAVPNPNLARDRGLVASVYRAVDSMLADILAKVGPETWVIVASDHGVEASPAATGDPREGRPGEHPYSAKGVLFITGPNVKAGHRIEGATPYDLMPTFAWLLGLPLSEEFEGKILTQAFDKEFVSQHEVRTVPSYGARQTSPAQSSPSDQLMIELLQSLGYVGG